MPQLKYGKAATLAILIAGVSLLGACREEEQDRFMIYEPGVYKGQKDQQLSDAQATSVRNRTAMQIGASVGSGPVGMVTTGDVRPPE